MKRRNFMLLTGLGVSAVVIPTWYFKYRNSQPYPILSQPELLSYIWNESAILEIGELYRREVVAEQGLDQLVELLTSNALPESITSEQLQQQVANDFKTNNTVQLDGWILSKTEARQCALFSLTQSN